MKNKTEVLSPVKNFNSAKIVIQNYADAIYLGSPSFSARSKVNLDKLELKNIIEYANSYNVKSFVAFNVVVFEDELENFFKEVCLVYNLGATGIILQDFSLANEIRKMCPDLELHASTQMNVHNVSACELIKDNHFCRVVVPREMTYDRIKYLSSNMTLDIEAFIHGAVCVSYSGQCYDSVLLDQKSANRGRCSQYCRMPQQVYKANHELLHDFHYPLNMKDMNNLADVDKYKNAGVTSLKIEGRLKNFDYSGLTTLSYAGKNDNSFKLNQVYNREFTPGLINKTKATDMVNKFKPNNSGEKIGTVIKVVENDNTKLGFYKFKVYVKVKHLNKGDVIRYISNVELGQKVEQIEKIDNSNYCVYSKIEPEVNSIIYRTSNIGILNYFETMANNYKRRLDVEIKMSVFENYITYELFEQQYYYELEQAVMVEVEVLKNMLTKTNNTPYDLKIDFEYVENCNTTFKQIKTLKNQIIEQIYKNYRVVRSEPTFKYESVKQKVTSESKLFIEVRNINQLESVRNENATIMINDFELASTIEDTTDLYLVLPSVLYDDQFSKYDTLITKYKNLCVSELGMYNKYKTTHNIITNYSLNSTNQINLKSFKTNYNVLSMELNKNRLNDITLDNSVVMVYGHIPVMIMDYCPVNLNKQDGCGSCRRCRVGKYYLKDEQKREFNLVYEGNDKIMMYSSKPLSYLHRMYELKSNKHLIRLTNEDVNQIKEIIECYTNRKKLTFEYNEDILDKVVL